MLMELCLSYVASIKRWLHGVQAGALFALIWYIAGSHISPHLGANCAQQGHSHHHHTNPFCPVNIKCHTSIPDANGSLFELCGIHKTMITWCTSRSTFCHDLVHCREPHISPHLGANSAKKRYPHNTNPFCPVNIKCHPSIPDGALLELCGIHKTMIALCRSSFCHYLVHLDALFHHIWRPIMPNKDTLIIANPLYLPCQYEMPPIHT